MSWPTASCFSRSRARGAGRPTTTPSRATARCSPRSTTRSSTSARARSSASSRGSISCWALSWMSGTRACARASAARRACGSSTRSSAAATGTGSASTATCTTGIRGSTATCSSQRSGCSTAPATRSSGPRSWPSPLEGLDRYVAVLPGDGAIDEGYSYWWNGACRALEALDILAFATARATGCARRRALPPRDCRVPAPFALGRRLVPESRRRPGAPHAASSRGTLSIGPRAARATTKPVVTPRRTAAPARRRRPSERGSDGSFAGSRMPRGWLKRRPLRRSPRRRGWHPPKSCSRASGPGRPTVSRSRSRAATTPSTTTTTTSARSSSRSTACPSSSTPGAPPTRRRPSVPDATTSGRCRARGTTSPRCAASRSRPGPSIERTSVAVDHGDEASLSLDIAGAYAAAGLVSWRRTARLERGSEARAARVHHRRRVGARRPGRATTAPSRRRRSTSSSRATCASPRGRR